MSDSIACFLISCGLQIFQVSLAIISGRKVRHVVFPTGGFHCPLGSLCLLQLKETMTTIFVSISSPLDASDSICSVLNKEVNIWSLFLIINKSMLMWVCFARNIEENKNGKVVCGLINCLIPSLYLLFLNFHWLVTCSFELSEGAFVVCRDTKKPCFVGICLIDEKKKCLLCFQSRWCTSRSKHIPFTSKIAEGGRWFWLLKLSTSS